MTAFVLDLAAAVSLSESSLLVDSSTELSACAAERSSTSPIAIASDR